MTSKEMFQNEKWKETNTSKTKTTRRKEKLMGNNKEKKGEMKCWWENGTTFLEHKCCTCSVWQVHEQQWWCPISTGSNALQFNQVKERLFENNLWYLLYLRKKVHFFMIFFQTRNCSATNPEWILRRLWDRHGRSGGVQRHRCHSKR